MASTPEAKVKAKVKRALKGLQDRGYPVYYHMPVQNGMGEPTLDFVGCANMRFFAIETKAPGKKPTERQLSTIAEMEKAGGTVFVYDGKNTAEFGQWLSKLFA